MRPPPKPKAVYRLTRRKHALSIPLEVVAEKIRTNMMFHLARCAAGEEWQPAAHSDWDGIVKQTFPDGIVCNFTAPLEGLEEHQSRIRKAEKRPK